jgi:hypothetical protein
VKRELLIGLLSLSIESELLHAGHARWLVHATDHSPMLLLLLLHLTRVRGWRSWCRRHGSNIPLEKS